MSSLQVEPIPHEATRYWVGSRSRPEVLHLVDADWEGGWGCSCEDFTCRKRVCIHIKAVMRWRVGNLTADGRG